MSDTIISRREEIYQEFRERLGDIFPQADFERGFHTGQIDNYNQFYIMELPESCDLHPKLRGMYQCTYAISISYWVKVDKKHMHEVGNLYLERIRLAIELDENLTPKESRKKLVTGYYMDEGALIWYDEGVVDVELLFIVAYTKEAGWANKPFSTVRRK